VSRELGPAHLYRRILGALRTEWGALLAIAAIVFLPLSLVEALSERGLELEAEELTILEIGAVAIAGLVELAGSLLGEVFYAGAVAAILVGSRTGIRRRLSEVARELPYLRLIGVDILYILGVAVGLVLLVVPGVAFFAYFALTAPIVEIERRGIRAAFGRSLALVRGRFWTVVAVLLPVTVAIELITEADQALVAALLGHSLPAEWLATAIVNIALTPIYAVAAVVLTIELIDARGERLRSAAAK
jgi:hypothetical protein